MRCLVCWSEFEGPEASYCSPECSRAVVNAGGPARLANLYEQRAQNYDELDELEPSFGFAVAAAVCRAQAGLLRSLN
jgi:hypothetical protein